MAEVCGEWGVSIRRACRTLEATRATYHYKTRRRDQAGLAVRIKEISQTRVRYGYRRVHVLLRREGWEVNMKRTYRIYKALGLQLRNKTPKRRVKAKLREDRCQASRPHVIWSMDFVHDVNSTRSATLTRAVWGRLKIRVKIGHKAAGWSARARLVISPTIPRLARPAILL